MPQVQLTSPSIKERIQASYLGKQVSKVEISKGSKLALGLSTAAVALHYLFPAGLLIGSIASASLAGYLLNKGLNLSLSKVVWDKNETTPEGNAHVVGSIKISKDGSTNFTLKTTLTSPDRRTITTKERIITETGETTIDSKTNTSEDGKSTATQKSSTYSPHA